MWWRHYVILCAREGRNDDSDGKEDSDDDNGTKNDYNGIENDDNSTETHDGIGTDNNEGNKYDDDDDDTRPPFSPYGNTNTSLFQIVKKSLNPQTDPSNSPNAQSRKTFSNISWQRGRINTDRKIR